MPNKQEEIREGITRIIAVRESDGMFGHDAKSDAVLMEYYTDYTKEIVQYLHSQGVVIKVERKLPLIKKDRLKLAKLKEVIDTAVEQAGATDPNVIFYVAHNEYELERIGQFGIIPDVTINLEDFKAGYVAVEPLIEEFKKPE